MVQPSPLRLARKQAGLTQVQVAEALGVTQSVIVKWETAKTQPTMSVGLKLARLVGTPAEQLWGEPPDRK